MAVRKAAKKGFLDYYYEEEVRKNTVMIETLGKSHNGNGVYIAMELATGKYGDLEIFYSIEEENADVTGEFFDSKGFENIKLVISGSDEYRKVLAFSQYLFNDVDFPNWWIKKEEQTYVNLWHGTPLKKLGMAKDDRSIHHEGTSQRNFIMADYLLYPNEYTRDHMTEDFYLKGLSGAEVILLGYPRTGILLKESNCYGKKERLAEKRRIAFMPTWREGIRASEQVDEINDFLVKMEEGLPENAELAVNLHHKIAEGVNLSGFKKIRRFPKGVDTYSFLSTCDSLVTDYSSVMFDYAATGRKIILYCNDLDRYADDRGLYMSIGDLPFTITQTADELLEEIRGVTLNDEIEESPQIRKFRDTFCRYDYEDNVERLCRLIVKEKHGSTKKEKDISIIYDECFEDENASEVLKEYYDTCHDGIENVYLSFKNKYIDNCNDRAYPLIENVPVIATKGRVLLKGDNKRFRTSFENGRISIKKLMRKCRDDYCTEKDRLYPGTDLKRVILFETDDYEKIICFALFDCERYILITSKLLHEMKNNNIFKQSVIFFIKEGGRPLVVDNNLVEHARKSLSKYTKNEEIEIVDSAQTLKSLLELEV